MTSKKKRPSRIRNANEPLTRSARKKLMQSVDLLIANFESDSPSREVQPVATPQTRELDKNYMRLKSAAQMLNYWHSHGKYLTATGTTMPLPKTGKVSLASLAEDALTEESRATSGSGDLLEFGLVTKSGDKYFPNKRSAVVGKRSPLILAHATSAVTRLIDTVNHNVSGKKPTKYERQVAEVRINTKDVPQFLRFVEQQGQSFIDSIDDWLSTRESTPDSNQGQISVGVGAFAWTEAEKKTKKSKASASTRPRR